MFHMRARKEEEATERAGGSAGRRREMERSLRELQRRRAGRDTTTGNRFMSDEDTDAEQRSERRSKRVGPWDDTKEGMSRKTERFGRNQDTT
ncbi:hypothetical protein ERJ75_000347500 [Trypanosoma vivax]|nr:hypothetical protein ERJ75_000347500 [Trypanosoma vivax]